jgi:hypothetical protein
MIIVPNRKPTYGHPGTVMEIALLLYMQMMFIPHRKHTYGPAWPVIRIALLFIYR